ncbi:lytic transglycosylase domain-containing protein [Colwellia sp. RSH04]|uniref:lytic transglycosylase domain-containing protein n=1 Tax=Colwellia sp. RSH04 TaxID=2305464 RepID=UPI000E568A98|nr:lytic transglycosylase domain-containing protein [Colwellia sp. RSH04]RHW74833.1 lytic transglycosylase domain-containing protein [Colwellia sp. RSH04]
MLLLHTTLIRGIFLLSLFSLTNALAENNKHTPIYKYKSADGVTSFSGIEPIGVDYKQVRFDCYACKVDSLINWRKAKLYVTKYHSLISKASDQYDIDPAYVKAIIHAESHFDPKAISKQGAQGLMQLMPETAQWLGVKNPFVAQQNINGGVKHLSRLLKKYNGNISLTSAAYNAGEGTIKRYGGIPPYAETKVYVERVEILHDRYIKQQRLSQKLKS